MFLNNCKLAHFNSNEITNHWICSITTNKNWAYAWWRWAIPQNNSLNLLIMFHTFSTLSSINDIGVLVIGTFLFWCLLGQQITHITVFNNVPMNARCNPFLLWIRVKWPEAWEKRKKEKKKAKYQVVRKPAKAI